MARALGPELKARREALGLTQKAVSERLGVQRASLAQWEGDRHLPSDNHIRALDDAYGARGELVALAAAARNGSTRAPVRRRLVDDVFRDVADALVDALVLGTDGIPLGWSHDLPTRRPTPLSTAFVIRTLQLLDDARVDLHAVGSALVKRRGEGGWTNRSVLDGRPEVTAVVLAALARLGLLDDIDAALRQLELGIDEFARARPYILAAVLDSLVAIRPDAPLTGRLVRALLDARKPVGDLLLWPANADAPDDLVEPSLAHTARAAAVLRAAGDTGAEVDDAVAMAVSWMVARNKDDDGMTEILQPAPGQPAADIFVHHFTAAWCVRAMAGVDGVPPHRLQGALDILWDCYARDHRLWVWRLDGKFPSWMTHDAVAALRAAALSTFPTPLPLTTEINIDPDPGRSA